MLLSINAQAVQDGAQARALIRASGQSGEVQPQAWVVERAGQRLNLQVQPEVVPGKDGQAPAARVNAFIGSQPEMVLVRRGFLDGLSAGVHRTWELSSMTLRMMGRMLIGQASLKNISGPSDDRRLRGQVREHGVGAIPVVSRLDQHQPGRSQPATIARSGRWAPDVLSLGRSDGT